jgi:hypothetical protein
VCAQSHHRFTPGIPNCHRREIGFLNNKSWLYMGHRVNGWRRQRIILWTWSSAEKWSNGSMWHLYVEIIWHIFFHSVNWKLLSKWFVLILFICYGLFSCFEVETHTKLLDAAKRRDVISFASLFFQQEGARKARDGANGKVLSSREKLFAVLCNNKVINCGCDPNCNCMPEIIASYFPQFRCWLRLHLMKAT